MPKKLVITQDQIAARAFEIWEREGHPTGRDQDHWAQAEAELREAGVKKSASAKSAPKASAKLEAALDAGKTTPAKTGKAELNGSAAHAA
jgi:hypothetical protein